MHSLQLPTPCSRVQQQSSCSCPALWIKRHSAVETCGKGLAQARHSAAVAAMCTCCWSDQVPPSLAVSDLIKGACKSVVRAGDMLLEGGRG